MGEFTYTSFYMRLSNLSKPLYYIRIRKPGKAANRTDRRRKTLI